MKHFFRLERWFFTNGNKAAALLVVAMASTSCTYERVCGPVSAHYITPRGPRMVVETRDGGRHEIPVTESVYRSATPDAELCGYTEVWFWQETPKSW